MTRLIVSVILLLAVMAAPARADGPFAHDFQLEGRSHDPQVGIHFGLSQPLLLRGFNVAADFHWKRWTFEYSHGVYLDYNAPLVEDVVLTQAEIDAGLDLDSPWTTGFGAGYRLVDELALLVEVKAHRYEAAVGGESIDYTTFSIGPALAWRFFVWRGLFATTYLRYWPNVATTLDDDRALFADGLEHAAVDLGLFANVSVGWVFDL